jgi:hypothetical protein
MDSVLATEAIEAVATLEEEVSRLRSVLENIRDLSGAMALAAMNGTGETAGVGLSYLGRVAADALGTR